MKQKVLIVDDEVSIVKLLTFNIEKAGFTTDTAYDGLEAIHKAEKNEYDLIVLDLMLPEVDGIEVCRHLRQNQIDTPILMLTAKGDELDKILGLELGADDYLTKPFSPREVIARMKAILRRIKKTKTTKFTAIEVGQLVIYPDKHEARIGEQLVSFTRKEFELLSYLGKHLGMVLSRDQLLREVWGYDFAGDTRIVDVHVSRLREKIEENKKKPHYIKTVHGLGYKMEEPSY